jgi:hypothetical protein
MLSASQKVQLSRLRELYRKYNKQGYTRVDQHIVFRKGKKANCVSIDDEILKRFGHNLRL